MLFDPMQLCSIMRLRAEGLQGGLQLVYFIVSEPSSISGVHHV